MKTWFIVYAVVLFSYILFCPFAHGDPCKNPNIIGVENFDTIKTGGLPAGWWIEGGQTVGVEKGYLRITADSLVGFGKWCTVWTDIVVSGDAQISYDAHVFSSRGSHNNINFFLYYADPSGKPLIETKADRSDAKYSRYHEFEGYIVTFVNKGEHARIRIRRCPGFQLLKEGKGYHCRKGHTYHIKITKSGQMITFDLDNGNYRLTAQDPNPFGKGRLGFRTYQTDLLIDNFKVIRLPDGSAN